MTVDLVKIGPETGSVCQWCNDPKKNPTVHTYGAPLSASEISSTIQNAKFFEIFNQMILLCDACFKGLTTTPEFPKPDQSQDVVESQKILRAAKSCCVIL